MESWSWSKALSFQIKSVPLERTIHRKGLEEVEIKRPMKMVPLFLLVCLDYSFITNDWH